MPMIIDPDDLTLGTEVIIDTTNKTIQLALAGNLSNDGVTLQCLYSFCKEVWKDNATLIKFPFPFIAITEEKFELVNGWDFKDWTSKRLIRIGGWALKSPDGTTTYEEYAGIITLGVIGDNDQVYYVQEDATNATPTDIVLKGPVNQPVKIYGDATHGNFNYRNFFKIFVREYAKTYAMAQLSDIGVTTMTYQVYRFPLANAPDLKIVDEDSVVDTQPPYTNMSITWYTTGQERTGLVGGSGYFHVIIDGANGTLEQIYTFVQRQLRKDTDIDAGAGNRTGKITTSLLSFVGDTLYTLLYDAGKGTFVDNILATDKIRIFFRDSAGDLRNYPYTAGLVLNFGDHLRADNDAKYWVFFRESIDPEGYDYGTENAIVVNDDAGNPMIGTCTGKTSETRGYAFDTNQQRGNTENPPDEEIPIVVVAIGLSTAQFVLATGTIKRQPVNVVSLVAALERNYMNP